MEVKKIFSWDEFFFCRSNFLLLRKRVSPNHPEYFLCPSMDRDTKETKTWQKRRKKIFGICLQINYDQQCLMLCIIASVETFFTQLNHWTDYPLLVLWTEVKIQSGFTALLAPPALPLRSSPLFPQNSRSPGNYYLSRGIETFNCSSCGLAQGWCRQVSHRRPPEKPSKFK